MEQLRAGMKAVEAAAHDDAHRTKLDRLAADLAEKAGGTESCPSNPQPAGALQTITSRYGQ
jgi:hypothetical protein